MLMLFTCSLSRQHRKTAQFQTGNSEGRKYICWRARGEGGTERTLLSKLTDGVVAEKRRSSREMEQGGVGQVAGGQ